MIIEQPLEVGQPRREVWCSINDLTPSNDDTYTFTNLPLNALGYGSIVYVIDEPGLVLYYDDATGILYPKPTGGGGGGGADTPFDYYDKNSYTSAILKNGDNIASGEQSVAIGNGSTASGDNSFASGEGSVASGDDAVAEGYEVEAGGNYSHAEGSAEVVLPIGTVENNYSAGSVTYTLNAYTDMNNFAVNMMVGFTNIKVYSKIVSINSRSITVESSLNPDSAVSSGASIVIKVGAWGSGSHSEGRGSVAWGNGSHAEGFRNFAKGANSHTEGADNRALGTVSHVEGLENTASGYASHSEGQGTIANHEKAT